MAPLLIVIAILILCLPWYIAIKRSKGDKRYKSICQLCMVLNILMLMGILSSIGMLLLGERSDAIGKVAYVLFVIIPLSLGPYLGIKVFIYLYKDKLGKVGAKQICMGKI